MHHVFEMYIFVGLLPHCIEGMADSGPHPAVWRLSRGLKVFEHACKRILGQRHIQQLCAILRPPAEHVWRPLQLSDCASHKLVCAWCRWTKLERHAPLAQQLVVPELGQVRPEVGLVAN